MEAFELLGQWWIPQEQPPVVAGTLTFSHRDGIRLALMGALKPLPQDFHEIQMPKTYPLIIGVTQDGKRISLSECTVINSEIGFGGVNYVNQIFMVQSAYLGAHFTDLQAIRFHKIAVQYSHLPHWTSLPLLEYTPVLNEEGALKRYEMSYTPPDEIVATTSKGTITITSRFRSHSSLQEANFRQSVWVEIAAESTLSMLEWLYQFIGPLQNLLTLGTCKPNFLLDLKGYISEYSHTLSNGKVKELPIQIIYQQMYYASQIDEKLHPQDMLFMLQDIKDVFSQFIEKWFQIQQDLDSVCNLFFGIQYLDRLYLEQRFLNIAQAVESYHRRCSDKKDLPEEDHKKRLETILADIPQEYKKWLSDKLKYSNELSLRQRLKDLLDDTNHNQVVLSLIGNKKVFIDKVVNTRNYLTHYDKSGQKGVAVEEELYRIVQILGILLQACFLHELSVSPEQTLVLFRRNAQYQYMLSQRS